uniref:Centrosomal protein 89 n=1 Tax=Mastacembelus armatus TaxID=205130 RepID=A0A3Q3LRG4_9TELE
MLKFNFRRQKDKEFKHIAHGLIPAASIAPKPAVPRTPPPRSPNPSPERPRSALAAAILSSSLTGQTWAIPPARPRSLSESDQSESIILEPNISTALFTRDKWSEDLTSRPHLSSSEHSEEEVEEKEEEVEDEEDVYQTLDSGDNCSGTEPVYALPLKSKTELTQMSRRIVPSPGELPVQTTDHPCQASQTKNLTHPNQSSPESSKAYSKVQSEVIQTVPQKNTRMADEQKLLEERLQHLEWEISHSHATSNLRSSAGSQAELHSLRKHAQELVDENDALKLTVHRLNVELSRYQTRFRTLSKQESSKISGLPKTGPPPPWLVDMKYLSPLLLAYEDRMNEKDALLQGSEEQVKGLRVHVEEVIKENERLHEEIAKIGGINQKDCHELQQQAFLVLQENQVLIEQLEAQHVKAKANCSRHHSEVSKISKQLMLLEAEKQNMQEDLEESRRELQKNMREVQILQARLKDAVTWDEHCNIAGKLRRQLEQQESKNKSEMDELRLRVTSLQEENKHLVLDKAKLTADVKKLEADLELTRHTNRKAERRISVLKQQKKECALKEQKTRHYLGTVTSVAEHISQERDQLLHMASVLQQEKQGFISRILNGTVRFGKLQDEVKVYRRQASTRLAALEEAVEGKTASYQKEILHLQRLLRERQEAEERLLQSKREVEEELEVVWQAATRENQNMKEALADMRLNVDLHGWAVSDGASLAWTSQAPDETTLYHQNHGSVSPHFAAHQSPGLQRRSINISDSDHQNNSLDEKHKHGLDFYC